jgi:torulene dioxygenase
VIHDEPIPVELAVTGIIPAYAAGTLYRTGPGGYKLTDNNGEEFKVSHWFDGFSQTHRFQINPTSDPEHPVKVLYNSRHHVDTLMERIRKTGKNEDFSFGQKRDPCTSFFRKVMSAFTPRTTGPGDMNIGVTVSTNLPGLKSHKKHEDGKVSHGSGINTLWAKTDANAFKEIDPETLEPLGVCNQTVLNKELNGQLSGAHAKSDPLTGDVYNYNLALGRQAVYKIFKTSAATGETEILATVAGAGIAPAYIHSLFLSGDFVILCVWNSHIAAGGVKILWERNVLDAIAPFDPSKTAKWIVVDRKHGRGHVATFECPPFYAFHTINAWDVPASTPEGKEKGEVDIICELVVFENSDCLHKFYYENIISSSKTAKDYSGPDRKHHRPNVRRYRLPGVSTSGPATSAARTSAPFKQAIIDVNYPTDLIGELPTINPAFTTKPHRYIYLACDRGRSSFFDGLVKIDTKTQEGLYWDNPKGHTPGEAIYIANPEAAEGPDGEDDGVLLSVVLDGTKGKSYLLCLDARTMREVGRASLQCVVGFGFHGQHVKLPTGESERTVDF